MSRFKDSLLYIIFSFVLWLVVEFVTVWRTRFEEWISYMPWALFQYLFIILIFWFFLFNRNWSHKKVFVVMVIVMYVFEFLWQNFLLLNIIWFIPVSVLLIQIWGFLIFIPFWSITKSVSKNKKWAIFYCAWPISAFVIALLIYSI